MTGVPLRRHLGDWASTRFRQGAHGIARAVMYLALLVGGAIATLAVIAMVGWLVSLSGITVLHGNDLSILQAHLGLPGHLIQGVFLGTAIFSLLGLAGLIGWLIFRAIRLFSAGREKAFQPNLAAHRSAP
ncbi:hypothetical protein HNP46_000515 [Pseudomonas nitritireducens]|uniref:Uncharacterized protein n=1 Tax=Pseudomonas nitroreducens TaxID=46680 RepID=A0A7W7KF85_PSENT|nr:hypothetical protein [Pseudomonas nitritireducens]MBB4861704.1 hypothetical protein [Pseudomonas nitritireducens]